VAAVGLAVYVSRPKPSIRQGGAAPSPRAYSAAVLDVASRFLCGCGSCDVPELADCVCPTAIQEKDLIEEELRNGRPTGDILKLVDGRYGELKPQFASLMGGASGQAPSASAEAPTGIASAPPASGVPQAARGTAGPQLATKTDASRIASQFICACGSCQDHVLSECTCEHPRGAKEMKAFIGYKISQKQYSVAAVVDAVAYEYGHLRQAR
jgi:hypothetical protein